MKSRDVFSFTIPAELTVQGGHLIKMKGSDSGAPILKPNGQKLVREIQRSVPELEAIGIVTPITGVAIVTPISGKSVGNPQQIVDKFMSACENALGGNFGSPVIGERQLATVS